MEKICGLFGKTRQGWYDKIKRQKRQFDYEEDVKDKIIPIRELLPLLGGRKIQVVLTKNFISDQDELKIGRDRLFNILRKNGMLAYRKRRYAKLTDSKHWMRKYPNLIKNINVTRPNEVWVSDITFIKTKSGWNYLSLITDVYSSKIVGYDLSENMTTEGCLRALKMALNQRKNKELPLIHHSDRGCQYCSYEYVQLLNSNNIDISMTENGDPYENAKAERVNGILKEEFQLYDGFENHAKAVERINECISIYNHIRPHLSCNYLTPEEAHATEGPLIKRWKNYYSKNIEDDNILIENKN